MMKEVATVWKRVFKNFRYIALLFVVAFVFYLLNGFIANIPNIKASFELFGFFRGIWFLFFLSLKFFDRLELFALIGNIILSILLGILASLLAYRKSLIKVDRAKKTSLLSGIGILLGVAAPGCAVCGVGLFSLLGLSSALVVLPFNGREVVFIAIAVVTFSIFRISRKLYNPSCELNLEKNC